MWGEITNKKITNIKESYCLGEACLIFEYGKEASRTIAFNKSYDLKKALELMKSGDKNFTVERIGREVHIIKANSKLILSLVNTTHAERFEDVLRNYKQ